MRNWLTEQFLPLWAKETVLRDNKILKEENDALRQKIKELEEKRKAIDSELASIRKMLSDQ